MRATCCRLPRSPTRWDCTAADGVSKRKCCVWQAQAPQLQHLEQRGLEGSCVLGDDSQDGAVVVGEARSQGHLLRDPRSLCTMHRASQALRMCAVCICPWHGQCAGLSHACMACTYSTGMYQHPHDLHAQGAARQQHELTWGCARSRRVRGIVERRRQSQVEFTCVVPFGLGAQMRRLWCTGCSCWALLQGLAAAQGREPLVVSPSWWCQPAGMSSGPCPVSQPGGSAAAVPSPCSAQSSQQQALSPAAAAAVVVAVLTWPLCRTALA